MRGLSAIADLVWRESPGGIMPLEGLPMTVNHKYKGKYILLLLKPLLMRVEGLPS